MSEITRWDYDGRGLEEGEVPDAPWPIIEEWVRQAREAAADDDQPGVHEPDAISVATVDASGAPTVRTVLMRYLTPAGPGFYTNLESRKGADLAADPRIAASLTWPALYHAIRFTGRAEQLPRDVVTEYFDSRPWGSRISAWASDQSRPVAERADLEAAERRYAEQYPDRGRADDVPVPPFWGGYLIHVDEVEFWVGQRSRLHDRVRFTRTGEGALDDPSVWTRERLQP
ncbi:pyridoxamine 5'-phosphate oxidase [Allobranchiibius sp. CTAmp26]|uniref:pyridoxamine 5'-phosphate oxidase n=1 Tax=Allobranchiibius sp. CTAmp26 TaxID=2815214 RepID=UPI001AA140D9|nr:pyridoxamine 5'-phosphate oxidase [Allobranchiibius sp. CTAmp26]MBO1753578.1 pyridoxamine 5'-phosphate oxidase [Allobranchiibius sp. CTAmp26]